MKHTINIILILISVFRITAQTNTDYFGMPTDKPCIPQNEIKFVGDDMPITEILPSVTLPSPTPLPSGIAWDGSYLWVCGYNEYRIFCVDPGTGDTLKTIPLNIQRPYGICYYDSSLYVLDNDNRRVVILSYSGAITDTLNLLEFGNIIFPTGLYVCSQRLWFNDTKGAAFGYAGDSTMFIMDRLYGYPAYADFPSGIACDGTNIWVNDNASGSTAKINGTTFEMTQRFTAPGGQYPNGLAWAGNGLWYINNDSDEIYFVLHDLTSENITGQSVKRSFYPNPAKDIVYFNEICDAELFDFSGRLVLTSVRSDRMDIASLSSGAYLLKKGDVTEKLIIGR